MKDRTEEEITQEIVDTKLKLARLYRERQGRMVCQPRDPNDPDSENVRWWGWCVGCGKTQVCVSDGNDTCVTCLGSA